MKKIIICVLACLFLLFCLPGCSAKQPAAADEKVNAKGVASAAIEQASEDASEVPDGEQEKEESEQREEIAHQYSIYKKFGLSYDEEKDRFFYEGKMVRFFSDKISEENTNAFFYADGIIDLNPLRDASGKLTGLTPASETEFENHTAKQHETEEELKNAGAADIAGSFELGNPDEKDDTLSAYSDYGVSYDLSTDNWIYNDEVIHFFYDADTSMTYIDCKAADGLDLEVVRDKKGNVKKIVNMTDEEVSKILN